MEGFGDPGGKQTSHDWERWNLRGSERPVPPFYRPSTQLLGARPGTLHRDHCCLAVVQSPLGFLWGGITSVLVGFLRHSSFGVIPAPVSNHWPILLVGAPPPWFTSWTLLP